MTELSYPATRPSVGRTPASRRARRAETMITEARS